MNLMVSQDVALPLEIDSWYLSSNAAEGVKIENGTTSIPGHVVIPETPLKDRNEFHDKISIVVNGSNDKGWELKFKHEDGNFTLNISTIVKDGSGRIWYIWNNIYVSGR
jgi:hypothetical protein